MNIRRLNEEGLTRYDKYLDSLVTKNPIMFPESLLSDERYSCELYPFVNIDKPDFTNRFHFAKYLYEKLKDMEIQNIEKDSGLWAWLSLFYFDQLCRPNKKNERRPGERGRWIIRKYTLYFFTLHLVCGPFLIYKMHSDNPARVKALLCGPLNESSKVYLEIVKNKRLITCPPIIESITSLYLDPKENNLKKGAAGIDKPGGVYRLSRVLSQFDCNWDFHSMNVEDIFSLLPKEFNRFKANKPLIDVVE